MSTLREALRSVIPTYLLRGCIDKRRYATRKSAIGACGNSHTGHKLYAYRCVICKDYHLTKRRPREFATLHKGEEHAPEHKQIGD